jgi:Ca-activated chloride channel homolog
MRSRICVLLAVLLVFCLIALPQGSNPAKVQPPVIRVGEDGVFVRVLVTDMLNRYIAGLGKEHFQVYEDGVQQTVFSFAQQTAPVSIVMVYDLSASMKVSFDKAVFPIADFLKAGKPEDEYTLISFDQKAAHVQNARTSLPIQPDIVFDQLPPPRRPPLNEAIAMGVERIKKGVNEKKALIIVTDHQIVSSLPAIQIYVISGLSSWNYLGAQPPKGAASTGVRTFVPGSPSELDYYINLIHDEMRNQYVLGYSPTNKNHDGKWRKIEVKLNPPANLPKLFVNASQGYTALAK